MQRSSAHASATCHPRPIGFNIAHDRPVQSIGTWIPITDTLDNASRCPFPVLLIAWALIKTHGRPLLPVRHEALFINHRLPPAAAARRDARSLPRRDKAYHTGNGSSVKQNLPDPIPDSGWACADEVDDPRLAHPADQIKIQRQDRIAFAVCERTRIAIIPVPTVVILRDDLFPFN